jgi:short-subunit dehydrogenase
MILRLPEDTQWHSLHPRGEDLAMSKYFFLGAGLVGVTATIVASRRTRFFLPGKVVFISGGSRGLGLVLARDFARRGARVAISARDPEELASAASQLKEITDQILPIEADMTMREEAETALARVAETFGPIDVLVNNAGTIVVGPLETMTIDDYRNSINTHFWAPYFATMAVLPGMQKRQRGRIVNISSIGGKLAVPHLVPYSVGKFALTGFSDGLRSELRKDNIYVTTVCPGLMRTGSPRNAFFKGNNESEYAWFSIADALPVLSMNAERAARRIVDACLTGRAELVLSLPAKLAVKFNGIFPGTTNNLLQLMARLLPGPSGIGTEARAGWQSFSPISPSWLTALNEQASEQNNQIT